MLDKIRKFVWMCKHRKLCPVPPILPEDCEVGRCVVTANMYDGTTVVFDVFGEVVRLGPHTKIVRATEHTITGCLYENNIFKKWLLRA